jgi:hypothetical protein
MGTGMGYRDDFYVAPNIYGYTGDIERNPTVYFQTDDEHGRITQDHSRRGNIGRDVVKGNEGYSIWDELDDKGKLRTVEYEAYVKDDSTTFDSTTFDRVHRSRGALVLLSDTTDDAARVILSSILSQSIWRYTELKKNRRRKSELLPPLNEPPLPRRRNSEPPPPKPDWD